MKHSKTENQNYAAAYEILVCEKMGIVAEHGQFENYIQQIKNEPIIDKIANTIINIAGAVRSGNYVGRATGTATGDIIVNGISFELKVTSGGSGTYHNTSVSYFDNFNIPNFKDFYKNKGYYEKIEEKIKDKYPINEDNMSLVSRQTSKKIRHEEPQLYKEIQEIEEEIRIKYVEMIVQYLNDNNLGMRVLGDMIEKKTTADTPKTIPDYMIIANYNRNEVKVITKNEIREQVDYSNRECDIELKEKSFVINNYMRINIGWQNGNGLNNPTLRVKLNL